MKRRTIRVTGRLLPAALCALLVACGSSQVVREGGASPALRASAPRNGATVMVERGDSLYRIATRHGISALDLAMWNGIRAPYTIYPGQRLRMYPGDARRVASGHAQAAPRATRPARSGSTGAPRASVPRSSVPRASAPVRPAVASAPPPVAAAISSPVAWAWPAEGPLITRFVSGQPTRQGIDIAGQGGAPVRAAGDGVVVYSGSGLVGYGELIIVKHDDAWLSAYGHNRDRLVNEGQRVTGGQQIARMGRSGAARDMLHFEIRHNGKPVDPMLYLPQR